MENVKDPSYDLTGGINDKASDYITGPNQFLDIRNFGFERPGALVSRPGYIEHLSLPGASYLSTPREFVEYRKTDGFSLLVFDSGDNLYSYQSSVSLMGQSLTPGATISYPIDYDIGGDVLYYANGYTFQRNNASYGCFYNIPEAQEFMSTAGLTYNISLFIPSELYGFTVIVPPGYYRFTYAYSKASPYSNLGQSLVDGINGDILDSGVSVSFLGVTVAATIAANNGGMWQVYGLTIPSGYGISSIIAYLDLPGGLTNAFIACPVNASFALGVSNLYQAIFPNFTLGVTKENQYNFTLIPSYLETYNNMLFMAGFSTEPSTVYYSNLAQYERLEPENFVEVRTGNADRITCMRVFQNNLIVFKNRSIHMLSGDSPQTLGLKDMTLEYGCVNNTAAIQFNNKLWFMDEKGICEFNGPDTFIVSNAIEEKLRLVDRTKCRAIHVKSRSEVWFCCETLCFIYDYDVNAWTIYDGLPISSEKAADVAIYNVTLADVTFDKISQLSFFNQGASFISMYRMGESFFTDNGSNITLMAKTRFHKRMGESTEEIWRRLFFDSQGGTFTDSVTFRFRQNYGESIISERSMTLGTFQNRIDFGFPGKSFSVEWIIQSPNPITVNGYTVESRYLRPV